jgi:hypothetical protein
MRSTRILGATALAVGLAACASGGRTSTATFGGTVAPASSAVGLGPATDVAETSKPDNVGISADDTSAPKPTTSEPVSWTKTSLITRDWSAKARSAATVMEQQFGPPTEVTASALIWHRTGPWKRILAHSDARQHDYPVPHADLLEYVIDYTVPAGRAVDLGLLEGDIVVRETDGEISSLCDKVELCALALNLANDIVTGRLTGAQAREEYQRQATQFLAGDRPPYTQGLQFQVRDSSPERSKPEPNDP